MIQFRDYQNEAIDAPLNYYMNGNTGNPVVAMPTGTGKSVVIGGTVAKVMQNWPSQRLMVLTHVKELIEQNAAKLQQIWPSAPMGIYSAGLNERDTLMPIIFGGSGSVVNCVEKFGHRDAVFIDECHLLSPKADTTYQVILNGLKEINPNLRTIGYTATHYRLGQGLITDGGVFTDICCDMTGVEPFNRFIAEGYLSPLIPRRTKIERQSEVVTIGANGDFSGAALEADAANKELTYQALMEACEAGQDRVSWLVFASTVEDADFIAATLNSFGIASAAVHSKMPRKECDRRIAAYKAGELRCLVNMGMLTTGFDHPALDLIIMLRRTMSPGLWVQMLGRGTRPCPETRKVNCLVLDFAGNTRRLGPINDPKIPRRKGGGGGDAPCRICEACGTYNHAAARVCIFCGEEFTFAPKIVATASNEELIRSDVAVYEMFNVQQAMYYKHEKIGSPPMIKVDYHCNDGLHKFTEFVKLEHTGFAAKWSRDWWRNRFPGEYVPETTAEALNVISQLRVPYRIKVHVNKKYPEVVSYEY